MKKANQDLREAVKSANLQMWRVADKVGYSDSGFCVKLRKELPKDLKKRAFDAIEELKKEEREEDGAR